MALDHFRSWRHCVVDLKPGVNIVQGANGMGKTNLVEAIEVLSTGSSHRVSSSLPLVERGATKATVRANVDRDDGATTTTYEVTVSTRGANRGRINGGSSLYMRDIVGQVPSISFTPDDQRLVLGDPASRRSFLDQAGAMFSTEYAVRAQRVAKIAKQRVALLKQLGTHDGVEAADAQQAALSGLEVWTGQFIEEGMALTKLRQQLVDRLAGPFSRIYDELAGTSAHAGLSYQPSFDEVLYYDVPGAEISKHFQRLYPGEVARGRNLIGPHRDDLELTLEGAPAREFASNGETWTMALALKMALFGAIAEDQGVKPIVILDDVFAQLDETRRAQILDFAVRQDQVIVTVAAMSDIPQAALNREDCTMIDVALLKDGQEDGNEALVAALVGEAGRGKRSDLSSLDAAEDDMRPADGPGEQL